MTNLSKQRQIDIVGFTLIAFGICAVFLLESLISSSWIYLVIASVTTIVISTISYFVRKTIFPETIFFTLVVLSLPLRYWLMRQTGLWFAGINYLIPVLLIIILYALVKPIRNNDTVWRMGKIDRTSGWMIIGFGLVSALALFVWAKFFASGLSVYFPSLPTGNWYEIILMGLGFALLNATIEEILSRGFLWTSLTKVFNNIYIIVFIQAFVFGVFHKNGFPSGIMGISMVFIYSIMLALIRIRTNGMLGVIVCHIISDLSVFGILYLLKYGA